MSHGNSSGLARLVERYPGHEPIVTGAPVVAPTRTGGDRATPLVTMLRCSCGWHGGQVSIHSPGNGGRSVDARKVFQRHVTGALTLFPVPWWLSVAEAVSMTEETAA